MRERTASSTAEEMAGYRAIEMFRPKEDRVCEDPFARHFLSEQWIRAFKYPWLGRIYKFIGNLLSPGATEAVVARVRFIDEHIRAMKDKGLEQLVILGAGYDCRAFRLEEVKEGVVVFEVDHPATQEKKIRTLSAIFDPLPGHVRFVPFQFETDGFDKKLSAMGYDRTKTSLFIMEGLIMYLTRKDNEILFSYIAKNAGPKSSVVFDFLPPGIEDGSIRIRGGRNMYRWARRKGEPFRFGIARENLPPFLEAYGFRNVTAIAAEECRDMYFNGASRDRRISQLFSFAHASVD